MFDFGLGSIIGGAFSYFGAKEQADAIKEQARVAKEIAEKQLAAIKAQQDRVYKELNPTTLSKQATEADIDRAVNSQQLQSLLNPVLVEASQVAQKNLLDQLVNPDVRASDVANQLLREVQQNPASQQLKSQLIDAAINELNQGATLPTDVQAELVKSGLEKASQAGLGNSGKGAAGDLARRLLGTKAIELQQAREQQAANLNQSVQQLENQRTGVLTALFPQLEALRQSELGAQANAFNLSQSVMPDVGLSGTNIANLALARVGAQNQLTSQQGDVYARLANSLGQTNASLGQANATQLGAIGGAASGVTNALWNSIFSPSGGGGGSGVDTSGNNWLNGSWDPNAGSRNAAQSLF